MKKSNCTFHILCLTLLFLFNGGAVAECWDPGVVPPGGYTLMTNTNYGGRNPDEVNMFMAVDSSGDVVYAEPVDREDHGDAAPSDFATIKLEPGHEQACRDKALDICYNQYGGNCDIFTGDGEIEVVRNEGGGIREYKASDEAGKAVCISGCEKDRNPTPPPPEPPPPPPPPPPEPSPEIEESMGNVRCGVVTDTGQERGGRCAAGEPMQCREENEKLHLCGGSPDACGQLSQRHELRQVCTGVTTVIRVCSNKDPVGYWPVLTDHLTYHCYKKAVATESSNALGRALMSNNCLIMDSCDEENNRPCPNIACLSDDIDSETLRDEDGKAFNCNICRNPQRL